jgi:hypothetical protein
VCAAAHGTAFARWRQWSEVEKSNGWPLYGWFTALSCLGSLAGAVSYAARIGNLATIYISSDLNQIKNPTLAESQQKNEVLRSMLLFSAAYYMLYPLELGLVIFAKLLVLHRMQQFSAQRALQGAWAMLPRLFLAVVIACILVGVFSSVGTAVFFSQSADLNGEAVQAWAANDTAAGKSFEQKAKDRTSKAVSTASVQRFSEACVLLLLISAFLIVGVKSYKIIVSALRTLFTAKQKLVSAAGAAGQYGRQLVADASVQGKVLLLKVVGTFVFVFLTVLVRSVFHVLYAVAQGFQDYGNPCARSQCDSCKNVYASLPFLL